MSIFFRQRSVTISLQSDIIMKLFKVYQQRTPFNMANIDQHIPQIMKPSFHCTSLPRHHYCVPLHIGLIFFLKEHDMQLGSLYFLTKGMYKLLCRICIENMFEIANIQVSFLQFFVVFYQNYIFLLQVVFQCKNYSEITVETWTQLKSVIFTTDIFAVYSQVFKYDFKKTLNPI